MKRPTMNKAFCGRPGLFAIGVCLLASLSAADVAVAQTSDEVTTLKRTVQELKKRIEEMQNRLEEIDKNRSENADAVEATTDVVQEHADRPSAPGGVSIEGYGELHYNDYDANDEANDKNELDFHRFVLSFGYDFSDKVKLYTEIELEHALAGEGEDGAIELEQAFIEYRFDDDRAGRIGVFILPVGIMNEMHEPPTFYGVERNTVENIIIPAGWWAGGAGYTRQWDTGLGFDIAVHEGLKVNPAAGEAQIRDGRQKTSEARAADFAATARLKYAGTPGLELAATLQRQSDITQESKDGAGSAYLSTFHTAYNRGQFGLRALYARWDLDTENVSAPDPNDPGRMIMIDPIRARGYDEQEGWYIEPSFKLKDDVGVFTRYESVEGGRSRDEFDQWVIGLNYWLHEDVVLKADYLDRDHDNAADSGRDFDGFNLGFGYEF